MTRRSPEPDPGAHVRDQVRKILIAEDLACLGVKVRPPIPMTEVERAALARLRRPNGTALESKPPGSAGSPGSPGSAGSPGSPGSTGSSGPSSGPSGTSD